MIEIFKRITNDLSGLSAAIAISQKNPLFIFEGVFYVILSLILILFLTALGRKILKIFNYSGEIGEELLFSLGLGIIFWGSLALILGILGLLYFWVVWGIFLILLIACWPEVVRVIGEMREIREVGGIRGIIEIRENRRKESLERILIYFFLSFVLLNFIGTLTPEKGVDAIGYHLYFPKVYLQEQTMMLPARGSRLFSLFPHLASMVYLLPVSLNLPNVAQLFHFWLGILTAIIVALIVEKKHKGGGILASLFFYSTLVVGSISRSAYSDFFVTFFLSLGILGWVKVIGGNEGGRGKWGAISGLMFGGALATKNQSLALIPLFFLISLFISKESFLTKFLRSLKVLIVSLSVPFLWYLRSFLVSGSPFYPMFILNQARVPELEIKFINLIKIIKSSVIIQPIFLLIILVYLFGERKKNNIFSLLLSLVIYFYWVFLPSSFHDNRYFLPYLSLIIIVIHPGVSEQLKKTFFRLGLLGMLGVLFIPRLYTNSLYLPYVFGHEDKKVFLSDALRERTEDFYDIDGLFSRVINGEVGELGKRGEKKVLLDNVLGLFYVDFPFAEFEYSPFYGKILTAETFRKAWKENNYGHLLLKNESLADFFVKIGIGSGGDNLFRLVASHQLSKTFLYEPNFND